MKITEKPGNVYTIADNNKPLPLSTITNTTYEADGYTITHYSLGAGTGMAPVRYAHPALYIVARGTLLVDYKENDIRKQAVIEPGGAFVRPAHEVCAFHSDTDCVYTEIGVPLTAGIHQKIKERAVFYVANLLQYKAKAVARMDLLYDDSFQMFLLALDEGTKGEDMHAPGDTILSVLEGTVDLHYQDREFEMCAEQSFLVEAGAFHGLWANGKCKVLIVQTLEKQID